jgi:cobalt/nickel transport system permease protein
MIGVPLAVHISDGVLTWPWLAGGFALAGLLVAGAMVRVRDEEIPRIALMTAAFFVASLIHVPIGPTSVHLLLNGLLGVIVVRRSPLAVLLGLTLQAVLFGHGGFTTIGVNTCVMSLPALGAAWLFGTLRIGTRYAWFRAGLVVVSVLIWMLCLVYSIALFWLSRATGLNNIAWGSAAVVAFQPAVLLIAAILATMAAWMESRLGHASEFPAGLLVGMTAVLATLALNAAALLWGGAEDWHSIVLLVFVVHLPIAVVEGVILGFAVGFLARVKPEMLGGLSDEEERGKRWRMSPFPTSANGAVIQALPTGAAAESTSPAGVTLPPPALLFAVIGVLWAATPAHAHRLDADYRVRPDGQVQVESWFDVGGKAPTGAKVQVFRPDGALLREGSLDEQGIFVFAPREAENLKVVVSAGAGHRAEFVISRDKLRQQAAEGSIKPAGVGTSPAPTPLIDRSYPFPYKEILSGFGFLLGLAAFVMSLRNMQHLRELKRAQEEAARPTDDDHLSAGKTSSSGTSH